MTINKTSVRQIDIFGNQYNSNGDKKSTKQNSGSEKKSFFPKVNLSSGLNDLELQNDFMLIHRILQRKLAYKLPNDINKFIQILYNEMLIKSGRMDVTLATRTSLIEYFLMH